MLLTQSLATLEEENAIVRAPKALAFVNAKLGYYHAVQGQAAAAESDYREALAMYRQVGAVYQIADTIGVLFYVLDEAYHATEIRQLVSEALANAGQIGRGFLVMDMLRLVNNVNQRDGDYYSILVQIESHVTRTEALGDYQTAAWLYQMLGFHLRLFGDYHRSCRTLERAL